MVNLIGMLQLIESINNCIDTFLKFCFVENAMMPKLSNQRLDNTKPFGRFNFVGKLFVEDNEIIIAIFTCLEYEQSGMFSDCLQNASF